jgi:hypothetical protein
MFQALSEKQSEVKRAIFGDKTVSFDLSLILGRLISYRPNCDNKLITLVNRGFGDIAG